MSSFPFFSLLIPSLGSYAGEAVVEAFQVCDRLGVHCIRFPKGQRLAFWEQGVDCAVPPALLLRVKGDYIQNGKPLLSPIKEEKTAACTFPPVVTPQLSLLSIGVQGGTKRKPASSLTAFLTEAGWRRKERIWAAKTSKPINTGFLAMLVTSSKLKFSKTFGRLTSSRELTMLSRSIATLLNP